MGIHADMRQFGVEGSTPKVIAERFMDEDKEFIEKIYPNALYKSDEDIMGDSEAMAIFTRLIKEHELAVAKHQAFALEKYRIAMAITLPFKLLDIIEGDPSKTLTR